ncbi:MAG TPA: double zinc ribbon domain-containing protein [Gemmatimonadaceae bacterium]|nr:double zinc ribbon domain-containing protein [Gemmatimonadaceae bacterium]
MAAGLALLLPRHCVVCEARLPDGDPGLGCGACWARLPRLPLPQCERCGYPLAEGACRWCPLLPAYVRGVRSVCWMPDGVAGELVHALKYHGWWRLADEMAVRMARLAWPADVIVERAAVIPVPLSRHRERERGFNQSERLAAALAARWHLPAWNDVLVRTTFTTSQTRLTPEQRLHNVAGAFGVAAHAARIRDAHLMLVDDVVTTAATLNACAAALFTGGARLISYVTFGRARLPGDAPS